MYKAYIVAVFILVRAWREKGTTLHGDGYAEARQRHMQRPARVLSARESNRPYAVLRVTVATDRRGNPILSLDPSTVSGCVWGMMRLGFSNVLQAFQSGSWRIWAFPPLALFPWIVQSISKSASCRRFTKEITSSFSAFEAETEMPSGDES